MYCEQCGAKLEDGARFCIMCGAKVSCGDFNAPKLAKTTSTPVAPKQPAKRPASAAGKKKSPVKYILVLIVVVVAVAVIVVQIMGSQRVKVNLNEYVTISASGTNGSGYAQVEFDYEALYADYSNKIKLTDYGENSMIAGYIGLIYNDAAQMLVYQYISGSVDQYSGLSNGDTITYTWNLDEEETESYFQVELVYSDIQYVVSGLSS